MTRIGYGPKKGEMIAALLCVIFALGVSGCSADGEREPVLADARSPVQGARDAGMGAAGDVPDTAARPGPGLPDASVVAASSLPPKDAASGSEFWSIDASVPSGSSSSLVDGGTAAVPGPPDAALGLGFSPSDGAAANSGRDGHNGATDDGGALQPALTIPAAAKVSWAPAPIKQITFEWEDVEGATFYRVLEDADGDSGFTQIGGDVPSGVGFYRHLVPVLLSERLDARYVVESCNSRGCSRSRVLAVFNRFINSSIGYIKDTNPEYADGFGDGVSVDADGDTLVVSTRYEASNATGVNQDSANNDAPHSGAAYVFTREDGAWSQRAYIKASNAEEGDMFGFSVSVSGNGKILAVGAAREGSNSTTINAGQSNNDAFRSGAVYIFARDGDEWSQQAYLKARNADTRDEFGFVVSLDADGDTLAVGARSENVVAGGVGQEPGSDNAPAVGAAYVFSRKGTDWSQTAYIKASNAEAFDYFGSSISLSADGETLAVGATAESNGAAGVNPAHDDTIKRRSGAVYVFSRASGAWAQRAYLKASNPGKDHRFGYSVALSAEGSTLAVGAVGENSGATGINGDQDNDDAGNSGAVYVFTQEQKEWKQQAYLKADNTARGAAFGEAIGITADGNILAVGAYYDSTLAYGISDRLPGVANHSGAVYVFSREGAEWSQRSFLKAPNTDNNDFFGQALGLSADGTMLAVGALGEDGDGVGVITENRSAFDRRNVSEAAGAVYIY